MAAPVFQAAGAIATATGDATAVWPAHQPNHVGLLLVWGKTVAASSPKTLTGWTLIADGGGTGGSAANDVRWALYWCRATSAAEPNIAAGFTTGSVSTSAIIITYSGVITTGAPYTDISVGGANSYSATFSSPSASNAADAHVVIGSMLAITGKTATISNSNIAGLTSRAAGNGNASSYAISSGTKAAAGTTGTASITWSGNPIGYEVRSFILTLIPAPPGSYDAFFLMF